MSTLQALASDPDWTPSAINILAPSLAASEPLVRRLDALPRYRGRSRSAASFHPASEKLALVGNAAMLLKPVLDVAPVAPPSDSALKESLATTAAALHEAAAKATDSAAVAARRLADALSICRRQRRPCVPRHRRRWSTRSGSCSIGHAPCCRLLR